MKTITIDDELYAYIASQTKHIGESASDILRRLLLGNEQHTADAAPSQMERANDSFPSNVTDNVTETFEHANEQASSQAHTLAEGEVIASTKGGDVVAYLKTRKLSELSSRVDVFLAILAGLYACNASQFDKVLNVKGRNRLYFANSKEKLLESGSSTNPKQIPGSQFWVVTNNNTAKKSSMLSQAAEALGYDEDDQRQLVDIFTQ
ncbi:replication initiation negative regulator SeqA [Aestuariibacter sp. AA17]|uniref:Negative modulator of initiation of replication n=1 Tax=Fluctibacter corallii TaxID=2984329 RepID=A0ABT3A511_9ALTE|nr:replication initiation negative regulator SeqA [Aestuariibacter sp. AA17]MCV2883766.1 replication initiation negative regulator SeqA [Aestuariibacter sp. AA17]